MEVVVGGVVSGTVTDIDGGTETVLDGVVLVEGKGSGLEGLQLESEAAKEKRSNIETVGETAFAKRK